MNSDGKRAILIGMPLKNNENTLRRAVESVFKQRNLNRKLILFIVNDGSTDNWKDKISDYLDNCEIIVENVKFGRVHAVRNYILDYVYQNLQEVEYIGRLDADDRIVDSDTLSRIENVMNLYSPDVIMAGNIQVENGQIVGINRADKRLLDDDYLESRLFQMANGNLTGELPSCNTFVKPSVSIRYKNVRSAEDHWYTVDLLLNKDKYDIYIAEDILYSVYTLSGNVTRENKEKNIYLKSRRMLYQYFLKNKVK